MIDTSGMVILAAGTAHHPDGIDPDWVGGFEAATAEAS